MGQNYFSGANSGAGFYNYFDGITPVWERLERFFLIKGGPGVGKSTLMKRVAKQAEEAGEEVECFYCSGDPDSLDAVRLVNRGIVFADATSPHCMDPKFPGAVEEIVNLGEQIDRSRIVKHRDAVEDLTKRNKIFYGRAYAFLGAAAVLENERYKEVASCVNRKIIKRWAEEMGEALPIYEKPQSRKLFLDAITCKGRVSFAKTLAEGKHIYRVTGAYKEILTDLLGQEMMAERKELFCNPLRPQCSNHVLLSASGLILTSGEGKDGTELASEDFLIKECDKTTEIYEREARRMEEEAMKCLKECKKIHDELEEIYRSCVDFVTITDRTEKLLSLVKCL